MISMKRIAPFCLCLALMAVCSCVKHDKFFTKEMEGEGNGNGSSETYTPTEFEVKGQVEKGPFISGSVISMQPLNEKMHAMGSTYSATITDDMGSFSFNAEKFSEPFARLSVNGYFYNEYKGALSNGQITLQSVVDLRDKSSVNVNLLTHLKYQRVLNLIKDGASFADANAQAQEELLKAFGLQNLNTADVSQFSVAAGTDEAAALIVTSALLLGERSEAQFTEYLAKLCKDFAASGEFSKANKEQINKDKEKLTNKLKDIRQHLIDRYKELNHDITVKDLVYYVDWDNNGTAGDESHDPDKPVTLSQTSIEAPAEGGTFTITYNSDVKLYLTPQMGVNTNPSIGYLILTGQDISCHKELTDDNTLIVTVDPASYQDVRGETIWLYDYLGTLVAKIPVKQTGDPNGKLLTAMGEQKFKMIKEGLLWDRGSLNLLIQDAHQLNPSSPDGTVYHLDDVLIGYWALGKVLDNRYANIENIETALQQAIENLNEQQPMGNCETPEQLAKMSADVIRYVLAKYYIERADRYQDAKTLLEAILNKNVYSNSYPIFAITASAIISYQDVNNLYQMVRNY